MRNPDVMLGRRVPAGLSRLKPFLALSRTPHLLLDLAAPALSALLWLRAFPSARVMVLGFVTAFAGYTAVYALNDLVDFRNDRKKVLEGGCRQCENYLDGAMVRHPMAQGLLSFLEGLLWAGGWALVSLICAYLLNPVCVLIFLAGASLEIVYCLLWKISPFRTVVSGAVKTCGALAAVYAVDSSPSLLFLGMLFCWLFSWEIGGQNIPNDWAEIEEDTRFQAKTVLIQFGAKRASVIALACVFVAFIMNPALLLVKDQEFPILYGAASSFIGFYLLLIPAYRLFRTRERLQALILFKKASYYPLALLIVLTIRILAYST
ncbi:MAG: UbiA family prenyltransferase [Deltaproteobacteria bacterium]|nr:UbiA family prenyltransferase [Deltaproteobacteria bacterium]